MERKNYYLMKCLPIIAIALFCQVQVNCQTWNRDTLIDAAFEIVRSNPYCALITVDSAGQSQVRTMNPYPLQDDMIIWFATARKSHKVKEIRNNPLVSVYYADHNYPKGYVNFIGKAEIIDDIDFLVSMRRQYWDDYGIDWKNNFVLIKIIPLKMNVVNYQHGLSGDPVTLQTPYLIF